MESSARKSLLVMITSDPRSSHRPAEAIRIAAGVAAWRQVEVSVYLAGPAVLALSADVDDFLNQESFTQFLPMLIEYDRPILAEAGAPALARMGEPAVRFEAISTAQLATRATKASYLLRF